MTSKQGQPEHIDSGNGLRAPNNRGSPYLANTIIYYMYVYILIKASLGLYPNNNNNNNNKPLFLKMKVKKQN